MNGTDKKLNLKRIFVGLVMTLSVMILTACGANVDAKVELNSDGSGTRTMELSIPKTELQAYGKFDLSKVESVIADNCPQVLDYSYEEDKKNVNATFVLQFSSLEDYEQKLNTFCSGNAQVDAYVGASPFSSEMRYSESVSTKDMLKWLVDALVDNNIVSDRYRSSIIGKVTTRLLYGGKVFSAGSGRLSVSENIYCTIDSIDIYTTSAGADKYSRTIRLNMQEEELEKNKENINAFLGDAIPEGGFGEWDTASKDGVKTFAVTLNALSSSELTEAMKQYTGSQDCNFAEADASTEDGLFYKGCAFREKADWSAYGCNANGTVNINYMIDMASFEGSLIDEKNGASRRISGEGKEGDNYVRFGMGEVSETSVYADFSKYYHFSSIDYLLDVNNRNDITKEITLYFDNASAEDIGEICDKVHYMAKSEAILDEVGLDFTAEKLTITMKGTADEINEMMNLLSGNEGAAGVSYACEKKWLVPFEKCIVTDVVDLEGIVYHDPNGDAYWDIPINYKAKLSGNGKKLINEQPNIDKKAGGFEGKLSAARRSKAVYKMNHINGLAFVWYLLLFIGVVGLIAGIYFLIRSVVEKKKEMKEEQHAREIGMGEAVEIEMKETVEVPEPEEIIVETVVEEVEEVAETVAEPVEEAVVEETVETPAETIEETLVETPAETSAEPVETPSAEENTPTSGT